MLAERTTELASSVMEAKLAQGELKEAKDTILGMEKRVAAFDALEKDFAVSEGRRGKKEAEFEELTQERELQVHCDLPSSLHEYCNRAASDRSFRLNDFRNKRYLRRVRTEMTLTSSLRSTLSSI